MLKHGFFLTVCLLLLLTACAPTRYPPGYHMPRNAISNQAVELGEGGYIKRGNPYKIDGKMYSPLASGEQYNETGVGSWYGKKFHGRKTANGETYNMYAMTAAHTTLPMPSMVLVTNLDNGKSIKVRINDRGPFVKDRLIDLSYSAAKAIGYAQRGTANVRVQTLDVPRDEPKQPKSDIFSPITFVEPGDSALSKPMLPTSTMTTLPITSKKDIVETTKKNVMLKQAYIQIGAFAAEESASEVVHDLKSSLDETHPPLQVMFATNIYRVRLGPFDLDADAELALQHVRSNGYDAAMIIHD